MTGRTGPAGRTWMNGIEARVAAIVVAGVLLVAGGGFVASRIVEHERTAAVAAVEREAANLARAYEEHVHQVVRRLDQALSHLRDEYERDPASLTAGTSPHVSLYSSLAFQLAVVDAKGLPVFSTLDPDTPPVDFGDRKVFRALRDSVDDRLHVGEPMAGSGSGQRTVPFGRRLRGPDGAFAGAVFLSVHPERLASYYGPAEIGTTGSVMLVGNDRVVRARSSLYPAPLKAVGSEYPDRPFSDPARPPAGVYHSASAIDGVRRIVAYRRLSEDPLVSVVALGEGEAMAPFEERRASIVRTAAVVSFIVLGATALVAWLTHLQGRQRQRLVAAQALLGRSEERWRLALDAVGDGVWDWNAETGHVFYSARWKAMLGFADDEIGDDLAEWEDRVHPADREAVRADLDRHIAGRTPFYSNKHRVRGKDGHYRWILDRGVVVSRDGEGAPLRIVGTHTDIGDIMRIEQALSATVARLSAILDSAPVGISIVDAQRRIVIVNPRMAHLVGREPDDLVGVSTRVLYDSDARFDDIGRRLYPIVDTGGTVCEELTLRHRDGTWRWVRMTGRRVSMEDASLGIVWVIDDIDERKAAEQALEASTRFQRTLIDTIPIPIYVKDAAGCCIDANAAFERWLGVDRQTLEGTRFDDRDDAEGGALPVPPHARVYEARMTAADGGERDVEFSKAVFCDGAGNPAGIVGAMVDISERKQAEQALRERQNLFEQIFVANLASKLLIDPEDGRIIDANPAAAEFYGRSLDELKTMRISDINTLSVEDIQREMEWARAGRRKFFLFRHRVSGGEVRDVEVYVSPIQVNGRRLLLSHIHDITERHRAEEALERQTEELRRSNAELEAFAYVASHDLRQPLRTINSYLGLLTIDLEGKLDEDGRDYMAFVRGAAQRMDRLIVDLLEYSRVGRRAKGFEACAVAEIVDTAMQNLEVAVAEASATVTVDSGLPTVTGDGDELIRLFQNIVGNAVKYRAPGRPPVIRVACEAQGGGWRFTVRDNGIGIADEHFERVFGIFQRLHGRDEYEGTGIGLALCRKIVEHHGGRIWVESEPGQGSTFHFTLPHRAGQDKHQEKAA